MSLGYRIIQRPIPVVEQYDEPDPSRIDAASLA